MNNAFSHIRNYLSYLMRIDDSEYVDFINEFGDSVGYENLGAFLLQEKYVEYCGFLTVAGLEMIPKDLRDFSGVSKYIERDKKLKNDFEKKVFYINKKVKFFLGEEGARPPIFADSIIKEIYSRILDRSLFFTYLDSRKFPSLSFAIDDYINSILFQYKVMYSPDEIVLIENANGDLERRTFFDVFGDRILQDFQIKSFKEKLRSELGSFIALKSRKEFWNA